MRSGDRIRDVALAEKVAFLRRRSTYGASVRPVTAIETHFSWVFLAGKRAYKLKKPVHQPPMDYRSVASRRRACEREVSLNRRLAPKIYLGVVPLALTAAGTLRLGSATRTVDWLVLMRRLPARRLLDRMIARGRARPKHVRAIIRQLAAFYEGAARVPMTGARYVTRLRRRTLENRRELLEPSLALDRTLVMRVAAAQMRYLQLRADDVRARAACIVDGHGDLRPEHVYLGLTVAVIDCLEFSPNLRTLDPLEEVAFLALECTRLGSPQLARALLDGFRAATRGAPQALVDFYLSQRAANRAKLAAWRVRDATVRDRLQWVERAHSYLYAALRHAEASCGTFNALEWTADTRPAVRSSRPLRRARPRHRLPPRKTRSPTPAYSAHRRMRGAATGRR